MYYQEDKKERRKIIAVATIAIAIILILIVAIIVVATKKSARSNVGVAEPAETSQVAEQTADKETDNKSETSTDNKSDASVDNKSSSESAESTGGAGIGNLSTDSTVSANSSTTSGASATASGAKTETSSNLPSTGPEDLLPIALIAGTLVAYLYSRKLAKNES